MAGLLDAVLGRLLIDSKPCIFKTKVPCKNMIVREVPVRARTVLPPGIGYRAAAAAAAVY